MELNELLVREEIDVLGVEALTQFDLALGIGGSELTG
jgi:hypothetical protein